MSDPIQIDLSDPGHLVDPPILDFLAYDPDLRAFVAEFVPDPQLSKARKESVFLHDGDSRGGAQRVRDGLAELSRALAANSPVVRIAHAGGGDFDFYTNSDTHITLRNSPSPDATFEVYNILQLLSLEAQLEFLAQRRAGTRAAG